MSASAFGATTLVHCRQELGSTTERRQILMKMFVLCIVGYIAQIVIIALVVQLIEKQPRRLW